MFRSTRRTRGRSRADGSIHALFHPDDGEAIEIKAGDTMYFDENSKGTWEVLETVRKAYLTFKRDHGEEDGQ